MYLYENCNNQCKHSLYIRRVETGADILKRKERERGRERARESPPACTALLNTTHMEGFENGIDAFNNSIPLRDLDVAVH